MALQNWVEGIEEGRWVGDLGGIKGCGVRVVSLVVQEINFQTPFCLIFL